MTALGLALVVAGGLTYLVYTRLRRNVAYPKMTHILVAAQPLPEGVALTAQDVKLADWPATLPLPGSYNKISDVVGKPLIYPLGAKEPILERDLGLEGSGIGLSVKIPAGMRATSVRTNEISSVAGFLYPGSHVDVLATFNSVGGGPVTQTILQDVQVLTAGQKVEPDPRGKPQVVNVVTLLLNPEDSQKLLLASSQGKIQFVLRNGADQKDAKVEPTRIAQLLSGEPARPHVHDAHRRYRRRVVRHPYKPPVYVLEVIRGNRESVQKF